MTTDNMQSTWIDLQEYGQADKCTLYDNRQYAVYMGRPTAISTNK